MLTWQATSSPTHHPHRFPPWPHHMPPWPQLILAGPRHLPHQQGLDENRGHVALPVQDGVDVAPTWLPHGTTSKHPNACFTTHVKINIMHAIPNFCHVFACLSWSNFRWCLRKHHTAFLDIFPRVPKHHKEHGFLIVFLCEDELAPACGKTPLPSIAYRHPPTCNWWKM